MNTRVIEKLRLIGTLLETGSTVGVQARDGEGCAVPYGSDTACKWSLTGAILKACPTIRAYNLTPFYISREIAKVFEIDGTLTPYKSYPFAEPSSTIWDTLETFWEGPGTSKETRLEIAKKLKEIA